MDSKELINEILNRLQTDIKILEVISTESSTLP